MSEDLAAWADAVARAERRIRGAVRTTPVELSPWLSEATGAEVWLKLEHQQVTGSFKARGALAKLTSLDETARSRGIVAASSGNHGLACAWAGRRLGCPVTVYVPSTAKANKRARILALGAELRVHGEDCVLAEAEARRVAAVEGRVYVSPYNDPEVVAGQGSLGLEIEVQVPGAEAVVVALGGGGLVGGLGAALKGRGAPVEILGASPAASPALHACLEAGRHLEVPCGETLSDGTAGGLEAGSITLPLALDVVDRSWLVEEEAIAAAMRDLFEREGLLVEGAAAVAVAALLEHASELRGRRVVVVLCGGNLDASTLTGVFGAVPGATGSEVHPVLCYADAPAAIAWLERAFGFEPRLVVPGPEGGVRHSELSRDGVVVMVSSPRPDRDLRPPGASGGITQSLSLRIEDPEGHCARARAAGAEILRELRDEEYGGRGYLARDPEGHQWYFGTYRPGRWWTRSAAASTSSGTGGPAKAPGYNRTSDSHEPRES